LSLKRFIYAGCNRKLIKKIVYKIRVLWWFFWEPISNANGKERAASADCKLGGSKHKNSK
jgi:hypothetical protein